MQRSEPLDLSSTLLRLRADASAEPLNIDSTFWQRLTSGELCDFHNERLVACGSFEADWPMWEMHPNGEEMVCLLSGSFAISVWRRRPDSAASPLHTVHTLGQVLHSSRPCFTIVGN